MKKEKKKKAQGTEQFQKGPVCLLPYIHTHTQAESSQKTEAKI